MKTLAVTAIAQSPAPGANPQTSRTSADQEVTVMGCIQREADFRRSTGASPGGAANTGLGVANEFILANAMMSPASSLAPAGAGASAATGTSGTTGIAYELSGANEGRAATYVGKRVEITGKLKPAEADAAGPTGGPTNVPGNRDLKLRELEVSSIREATGSCTATP